MRAARRRAVRRGAEPHALPAFAFEATRCFGQNPILLSYRNGLARPASRLAKAALDISVAAMMLVLSSALFLVLAVVSRLDGGPMFFSHRRVGAGGRPFQGLKFRTMVVDSDRVLNEALASDPALAKLVSDPRVTRIGRFLRKTSLDELPQLINVLRLVGPRPIVESEVPLYGESIAQYFATPVAGQRAQQYLLRQARPSLTSGTSTTGRSGTT